MKSKEGTGRRAGKSLKTTDGIRWKSVGKTTDDSSRGLIV